MEGSILTPGNEIFNIFIPSLCCQDKFAVSYTAQHAMPPEFGGKWGVESSKTYTTISRMKLNKIN